MGQRQKIGSSKFDFDVGIIGGGPAGASAGAYLAQQGLSVVIFEKERFPRFHIGESLLPNGNRFLQKIGVWEKIEAAGFVKKYGAEFETGTRSRHVHNDFSKGLVAGPDYSYQVERSRFDKILLDHAEESGCVVWQECPVQSVKEDKDHFKIKSAQGTTEVSWIIDASGRNCLLGRQFKLPKEAQQVPKRIAIFNHFEEYARQEGDIGGNIIITRTKDGWCWQIPINSTRTSVGIVATNSAFTKASLSPEAFFAAQVEKTPVLKKRFQQAKAKPGSYAVAADYSYSFEAFAGDRYLLAGDAACFTDPIFSSGVYMAFQSALKAATLIVENKERGYLPPKAQLKYKSDMKKSITVMVQLIDVFYSDKGFALFMSPTDRFKLFSAINSVVSGNTTMPFGLKWRYALFRAICRLNERWPLVNLS